MTLSLSLFDWAQFLLHFMGLSLLAVGGGPSVLFAAMMGWHVGLNAGGFRWAVMGAFAGLVAIVLPSACLTLVATRWTRRHASHPMIRAFKLGMAPLVVGLMLSSAALLASPYQGAGEHAGLWLLGVVALALLWRTRIHLVWVLLPAAALGGLGWV